MLTYTLKTPSIEFNMSVTDRHDLITPAKLRAWNSCEDSSMVPCWTDPWLTTHFAGKSALSAREISGLPHIAYIDRMWALTNALAAKGSLLPYAFALWCAEQSFSHLTPKWQKKLKPRFAEVCTGTRPASATTLVRDGADHFDDYAAARYVEAAIQATEKAAVLDKPNQRAREASRAAFSAADAAFHACTDSAADYATASIAYDTMAAAVLAHAVELLEAP